MGFMLQTPNSGSMTYKLDGLCSDDRDIDCLKEKALIKFFEKMPKQKNTLQQITFFQSKTYKGIFFHFHYPPPSSAKNREREREREIAAMM